MLLYTQIHRARGLQVLEREREKEWAFNYTHMKTPDEYGFSGISFQQVRETVFKERIIKAVNYITKLQIVSHIFFLFRYRKEFTSLNSFMHSEKIIYKMGQGHILCR